MSAILAAIGAAGGVLVERLRSKYDREKEKRAAALLVETTRLSDDTAKRKELEDAARDIREFLHREVKDLNLALDKIELSRAEERERWHQMLGGLTTKNLELEIQHRRDHARIEEMIEEASAIDDELKTLRTRVATSQVDATVMAARLEQSKLEIDRLRNDMAVIKNL